MPWHYLAKKDATTCEKLWGAGSKHRSVDIRMGEPGVSNVTSPDRQRVEGVRPRELKHLST